MNPGVVDTLSTTPSKAPHAPSWSAPCGMLFQTSADRSIECGFSLPQRGPNGSHALKKTKAVLVTQWFPPESRVRPCGSPRLCGIRTGVGVVTGVPHYPTGVPMAGHCSTDWRLETVRGFRTLRVPEYPSHDTSALRRMATFVSFALSSAGLATRTIGRSQVTLVYSSPATAALPAMAARARFGTPYVLLIQDLWPDSIFATGFLKRGAGQARRRTRARCLHRCQLSVRQPHLRHRSGNAKDADRTGRAAEKITLVYNWVDESILAARAQGRRPAPLDLGDDFIALYAGNLGEAQGLRRGSRPADRGRISETFIWSF